MVSCHDIVKAYTEFLSRDVKCHDEEGFRVIVTPLRYPDHDSVEVFVREIGSDSFLVTDMGESLRYLSDHDISRASSAKTDQLVKVLCDANGIQIHNGVAGTRVTFSELGDAIHRVALAISEISQLSYHARATTPATFKDEVAEFLDSASVGYERNALVQGITGREFRVDFKISTRNSSRLMMALSSGSRDYADKLVSRSFRDLYEVPASPKNEKFVLFDDGYDVWTPSQMEIFETINAQIGMWSERDEWVTTLQE